MPLPLASVPERFSRDLAGRALLLRCVPGVTALQTAMVVCSTGPERSWEIAPSVAGVEPRHSPAEKRILGRACQSSSARSRLSGSAIIAIAVITLVPATYQAGA